MDNYFTFETGRGIQVCIKDFGLEEMFTISTVQTVIGESNEIHYYALVLNDRTDLVESGYSMCDFGEEVGKISCVEFSVSSRLMNGRIVVFTFTIDPVNTTVEYVIVR